MAESMHHSHEPRIRHRYQGNTRPAVSSLRYRCSVTRTVAWWKRLPSLSSFKRLHKIGTTSFVLRKENHHREIKQPAQYHPANNGRMGFELKSTWYFRSPSSLHHTHAFPGTRPVRNMRISGNRSCHMGERIKFSPCDFFPISLLICPCFNVTLFLKQLYRDVIHRPHNSAI